MLDWLRRRLHLRRCSAPWLHPSPPPRLSPTWTHQVSGRVRGLMVLLKPSSAPSPGPKAAPTGSEWPVARADCDHEPLDFEAVMWVCFKCGSVTATTLTGLRSRTTTPSPPGSCHMGD